MFDARWDWNSWMNIWCFTAPDGRGALTCDPAGAGLPSECGPWERDRVIELGDHEDDLLARQLIDRQGFCLFYYRP